MEFCFYLLLTTRVSRELSSLVHLNKVFCKYFFEILCWLNTWCVFVFVCDTWWDDCRFSEQEVHPQEQSDVEAASLLWLLRAEGGDRPRGIRCGAPLHREGLGQTVRGQIRGRGQQRGGVECDERDRNYERVDARQTATAAGRLPDRHWNHHGHGIVSTTHTTHPFTDHS